MECKKLYDEKTCKIIDSALLNILSLCPESNGQGIWPTKNVADIIEIIAGDKLENRQRAASHFYCTKANTRGARFIGDGSHEFAQYERYFSYSQQYKPTHPTTSLALEYLANSYKRDAEEDKKQAIKGW